MDSAAQQAHDALAVLTMDTNNKTYLMANDPMGYAQAVRACVRLREEGLAVSKGGFVVNENGVVTQIMKGGGDGET